MYGLYDTPPACAAGLVWCGLAKNDVFLPPNHFTFISFIYLFNFFFLLVLSPKFYFGTKELCLMFPQPVPLSWD
jgi:hypothetical protein